MRGLVADDDFDRWIADLHCRVGRGDLADLPSFDVGAWTLRIPGEIVVKIMLADLEHLDTLPPSMSRTPDIPARRATLMGQFDRLRKIIG